MVMGLLPGASIGLNINCQMIHGNRKEIMMTHITFEPMKEYPLQKYE